MEYRQIEVEKARRFCEAVFQSYGFSSDQAKTITDVLIRADLFGIESHGMQRLIRYHNEIRSGQVDVKAKPEIVHETAVSAVIDAKKSMGQLASLKGMELAIKKAKSAGCGMVPVRNSNHYGIAGYYSLLAAKENLLGISMTNSEAIAVPTFGRLAMLGTNPIALAMPAEPVFFSYDAATTVVTRGKLEVYNKNEKPLPEQWALGGDGRPSTNAGEVLHSIINKQGGGIAPLGGADELYGSHKGYGFGMIVELFTAIFSGGLTANYVSVTPGLNGICHYFMALDFGIFGDKEAIKGRLTAFLKELRESPKAEGQPRIYTHGEKEMESFARNTGGKIPINPKTLREMQDIAAKQGVPWDLGM
ncbi:MAG: Ldh family oxidoreductase [Treponema sp.]|jgi:LDH2 family malate/lactate/ureidoglycolate dehydrogenase|nr:Ldh family oxidoreductase [Treponema sp.]